MSDALRRHGLQRWTEARLPCPSPSPRACSNKCPLSQRCHPTISSSVVPFSCPQSFPASGSFLTNWLFASGGQVLEVQHQSFQFRGDFHISLYLLFKISSQRLAVVSVFVLLYPMIHVTEVPCPVASCPPQTLCCWLLPLAWWSPGPRTLL